MTDPVQDFINKAQGVVQDVEAEAVKIEQAIVTDFNFLKHEATVLYNWAANASPDVKNVLDAGLKDAEAAAAMLAARGGGYLTGVVENAAGDIETALANFFQASGIDKANLPVNLTAVTGSAISNLEAIGVAAVKAAIPKILAAILAPAS